MIDRVFTKAEARYIPNGPGSTTDMAHPTRTGDLVVFSYPPYQFDAETPGTLVAAVALLRPARLRAGRPGPRRQHQHARDVPRRRRGHRQGAGRRRARSTSRRRSPIMLGIPEPQHSQGRVLLDVVKGGDNVQAALDRRPERLPRPARARRRWRSTGSTRTSAAEPFLATMFDEELAALPGHGLILAGGDNVGASPPNSAPARGHAGDRRRERVGPRRDLLRQPRVRLRRRAAAAAAGAGELPVPRDQHRRDRDRRGARLGHAVGGVHRRRRQGRRHRRRAGEHARARRRPAPRPA